MDGAIQQDKKIVWIVDRSLEFSGVDRSDDLTQFSTVYLTSYTLIVTETWYISTSSPG